MLKRNVLSGVPHDKVTASSKYPFRQPDIADDDEAIFVLSGVVGLYIMDACGKRQIVGLCFPGEGFLPGQRGRCGVWALVTSELAVASGRDMGALPGSVWHAAANRSAAIAHEWLAQSRAGAAERLAHLLCEIALRGGFGTERMPNLFTQQQLADITGQTSVNVNRVFAELEKDGLIARNKGEIIFKNWPELRRMAGFRTEYLEAA